MTLDYDLEDLERLESRSDLLSLDWNLSNRSNDDLLRYEENIPWSTNYDDLKDGTSSKTPEFDPKEPQIRDSLTLGQLKQLVAQVPPPPVLCSFFADTGLTVVATKTTSIYLRRYKLPTSGNR